LYEDLMLRCAHRTHNSFGRSAAGRKVDGNTGWRARLGRMAQAHQTAKQSDDHGDAAPCRVQKRGHVLVPLRVWCDSDACASVRMAIVTNGVRI
jgi:hypothetical protein